MVAFSYFENRSESIGKREAVCVFCAKERGYVDRPPGAELFAYLLVLDREWPRDWALAESRYQSGDLGLIPRDAVWY